MNCGISKVSLNPHSEGTGQVLIPQRVRHARCVSVFACPNGQRLPIKRRGQTRIAVEHPTMASFARLRFIRTNALPGQCVAHSPADAIAPVAKRLQVVAVFKRRDHFYIVSSFLQTCSITALSQDLTQ